MRTSLAIACVFVVAAPVAADDSILLAEFAQEGLRSDASPPVSMAFVADIASLPGTHVGFSASVRPEDTGMVLTLDAATLPKFNAAFHSGAGNLSTLTIDAGISTSLDFALWGYSCPTNDCFYRVKTYVPRLGTGLSGYNITGATMTIDRLEYYWDTFHRHSYVAGQYTVRVFGTIPEPATWLLAIAGFAWLFCRRK